MNRSIKTTGRFVSIGFMGKRLFLDLKGAREFQMYRNILESGGYECETTELVKVLLKPGMTFVDVGANNGYYTVLAAAIMRGTGVIWSFEPASPARARLLENMRLNNLGNVRVSDSALSDADGYSWLYANDFDDGQNTMTRPFRGYIRTEKVKTARMDALLDGMSVDLVKIDVEGYEERVIDGMDGVLSANPAIRIIMEWNSKYSTSVFFNKLARKFTIYRIVSSDRNRALEQVHKLSDLPWFCNLMLVLK